MGIDDNALLLIGVQEAAAMAGLAILLGAAGAIITMSILAHVYIVVPLRDVRGTFDSPPPGYDGISGLRRSGIWSVMKNTGEALRLAEAIRLAKMHEEQSKQRRQEEIDQLVGLFGAGIGAASGSVSHASGALAKAAAALSEVNGETEERIAVALTQADAAVADAQAAGGTANQLATAMTGILRQVDHSSTVSEAVLRCTVDAGAKVERLRNVAEEISVVLEFITHLASQANLLSLNAAVEAARAGEAGMGFAVVAQEVKVLAHQTDVATSDIGSKIEVVRSATEEVADTVAAIEGIVRDLRQVGAVITAEIDDQAAATAHLTRTIAQASSSAETLVASMAMNITATQRCSAAATEVRQAASRIRSEASQIDGEMKGFLAAMNAFAADQDLLIHAVDLPAVVLTPAGPVHGRITEMSVAFALFSGPFPADVGANLELRIDGFKQALRARAIGHQENGSVRLQLPLTHEHMSYVKNELASRRESQSGRPAAA